MEEGNMNTIKTESPPDPGGDDFPDIETLKGRLEQQKATKIKAEQIGSTLSRIKAREKASRRSSRLLNEKKNDDSTPKSVQQTTKKTNSPAILKEKSNLLRRKLEEDRAKFESHRVGQEDDLGKVSEIVENLRVQIEDRDRTIQQLHTSLVSVPSKHTPVQPVAPPEPDIPLEVKQRISDLEAKILDLQENLREKDSIISARTQAITLMSEDMSRKSKATVDCLEETRSQMKIMQANFVAVEERMNAERKRLKDELENMKNKYHQSEKNLHMTEAARFELSTRVAELQEKVVSLQTQNIFLEENIKEHENNAKELKESLDAANKQTIKIKAQFKAKLKALEEERDALKNAGETNDELTRLKERIAELEDEKEAGRLLKERIAEMEDKLQCQDNDLDNHVKAISLLESEKLDLLQVEKEISSFLKEKDALIEELEKKITLVQEAKISAEIKSVELEEKLESYIKSESGTKNLIDELEKTKQTLLEQQSVVQELTEKLRYKEDELSSYKQNLLLEFKDRVHSDVESELQEWKLKYENLASKLDSTSDYIKELETRVKTYENEITALTKDCNIYKHTVEELNSKLNVEQTERSGEEFTKHELENRVKTYEEEVTALTKDCDTFKNVIEELNSKLEDQTARLGEELTGNIENVINKNEEVQVAFCESEEKTSEIERLKKEIDTLHAEIERLKNIEENSDSKHNVKETEVSVEELTEKVNDLTKQLVDKNKELEWSGSELEERTRKLSEYEKIHELKSEDILRLTQELEASQNKIVELEHALQSTVVSEEQLKEEIEKLKSQDQLQKMKKMAASLKLKTKAIKDFENKLIEYENEKDKLINEIKEKQNELDSKNEIINQLNIKLNTGDQGINCDEKVQELQSEYNKIKELLDNKNEELSQIKEELVDAKNTNDLLMSEIENMQSSYSEEGIKNESILKGFEDEMLLNKNEIVDLGEQLTEVTSKYEQAWLKLQEKDMYIEQLEEELNKVKKRLSDIECTLEERRRSLEMKAELLGNRLQEAEITNQKFEKYEGELESKISDLQENERILQTSLLELKNENDSLKTCLNEYSEKCATLEKELGIEKNTVKELRHENEFVNETVATLRENTKEIERLNEVIKNLQSNYNTIVKDYEEKEKSINESMETEIKRLTERAVVIENERKSVFAECELLVEEKRRLEDEVNALKERLNTEQTNEEEFENEIDKIKLEYEENKNECVSKITQKYEIMINEKCAELEVLHREFEIKCKELSELESDRLCLHEKLTGVGRQLNMYEEEKAKYQSDMTKLQSLLAELQNENDALKIELLREKAKKEVDQVMLQAEQKFDSIRQLDNAENLFKWGEEEDQQSPYTGGSQNSKIINDLQNKLSVLTVEKEKLENLVKELEHKVKTSSEAASASASFGTIENKDDEDGWGWGSEETVHDEQHRLQERIKELDRKLGDVLNENSRLTNELKTSQIRGGKLLKKAKELKIALDKSKAGSVSSSGFDDLDFALQEELKSQIYQLEKNLKEASSELRTLKVEKENLLKRVDTLTTANERLIEMKECQDVEVEMWQKQNKELKNKVQGLEWKIEELTSDGGNMNSGEMSNDERQRFLINAMEAEEKLNSLAAENEYLQTILGELKDQQKKSNSSPDTIERVSELLREKEILSQLLDELKLSNICELSERVNVLLKENEILTVQVNNYKTNDNRSDLSERINELLKENEALNNQLKQLSIISVDNLETQKLMQENEKLNFVIKELTEKLNNQVQKSNDESLEFSNRIESLFKENSWLTSTIEDLNKKIEELNKISGDADVSKRISELLKENETLNNQLQQLSSFNVDSLKTQELIQENEKLNLLMKELHEKLDNQIQKSNDECLEFSNRIESLVEENSWLTKTIEDLNKRIEALNKVNNDTESLKVQILEITKAKEASDSLVQILNNKINEINTNYESELKLEIENKKLLEKDVELCRQEITDLRKMINQLMADFDNLKMEYDSLVSKSQPEVLEPVVFRGFSSTPTVDSFDFTTAKSCEISASGQKTEIEKLKKILEEKQIEINLIKEKLEMYEVEKKDIIDSYEHKIKQLENDRLISEVKEIKEAVFEQSVSVQEMESLKSEIDNLSSVISSKEHEINTLKNKIEHMKVEFQEKMREEIEKIKIEESSFTVLEEQENLKRQIVTLKKALEEKELELASFKQEKGNLHSIETVCTETDELPAFRGFADMNYSDPFSSVEAGKSDGKNLTDDLSTLKMILKEKEAELESMKVKMNDDEIMYNSSIESCKANFEKEVNLLNKLLQEKETELEMMKEQVEHTNVAKENLQEEYTTTIKEMKANTEPIQFHTFDRSALLNITSLEQPENIEDVTTMYEEIKELNKLLQDKETEFELIKQRLEEVTIEKENLRDEWLKEVGDLKAKSNYESERVEKMKVEVDEFKETIFNDIKTKYQDEILYKDEEIAHLMCDLTSKEQQLTNAFNELSDSKKMNESIILQLKEVETELAVLRTKYESMQNMKENFNRIENDLMVTVSSLQQELNMKNVEIENLKLDISEKLDLISDLQVKINSINEYQDNLNESSYEIQEMIDEIERLKNSKEDIIRNYEIELNKKNTEIAMLTEEKHKINYYIVNFEIELKKKDDEINKLLEDKTKIIDYVSNCEVKLEKKNEEIKELIEEKTKVNDYIGSYQVELKKKDEKINSLIQEINKVNAENVTKHDQESNSTDQDNSLSQEILYYQETIASRDAEIKKLTQTLTETQERLIRKAESRIMANEEETLRHRLDEALYTLHLRDVRCEELTLELMQLLEERDALQLRLSNVIRINEELRSKASLSAQSSPVRGGQSSENISLMSDEDEAVNITRLKEKLGQLHNVGYQKDPALQQDREKRHQEHMHLYTQNLTHEEESSPSGFFNWIFGSSSSSASQDI